VDQRHFCSKRLRTLNSFTKFDLVVEELLAGNGKSVSHQPPAITYTDSPVKEVKELLAGGNGKAVSLQLT
jgi:hypothetical protein